MIEPNDNFDVLGYYGILELKYDASFADIKQNYRNIAKIWHPDQNDSEQALEVFQKISVAHDVLKDDKKRLTYDLLSQVYSADNFPDMFALKIYKNKSGKEDAFVRSLRQKKVFGKIVKYSLNDDLEICSYPEAKNIVLKASLCNWILGWWSAKSFLINIKSLVSNFRGINKNKKENLCLLIHNAIAYWQEDKNEKALYSAIQAREYADDYQKKLLNKFMTLLNIKISQKPYEWNYASLKLIQLIFPSILVLLTVLPFTKKIADIDDLYKYVSTKDKEINYYQEVKHSYSSGRSFDDVLVGKILDIPVDIQDDKMLYYVSSKSKVMHAPGEDFDVLATVEAKTTVRVTGYTPDKAWYRIMLDSGDIGFVRREVLRKGIGKEIPSTSKIFKSKLK